VPHAVAVVLGVLCGLGSVCGEGRGRRGRREKAKKRKKKKKKKKKKPRLLSVCSKKNQRFMNKQKACYYVYLPHHWLVLVLNGKTPRILSLANIGGLRNSAVC